MRPRLWDGIPKPRAALLTVPVCMSFCRLIPESLHWLVAHGRSTEACQMIRKAARTNRHASAELQLDKLELEQLEEVAKRAKAVAEGAKEPTKRAFSEELQELLRTRILVLRLINCCICWLVVQGLHLR